MAAMDALERGMRIIANFHKGEALRFTSHLDIQRLVQRAMRRAELPLRYSQGFNPHPLLSFASALSVGYTSDAEWLDIQLEQRTPADEFSSRVNAALPEGLRIIRALELDESMPALTALLQKATYKVSLMPEAPCTAAQLQAGIDALLSKPIMVEKRTKSGNKMVDLRPMVLAMSLQRNGEEKMPSDILLIESILTASGGLSMELFMQSYLRICGIKGSYHVHRAAVEFERIGV